MIKSFRQIASAKSIKKSIQDWIESEMTDEIKEDVYDFFKTSDKYYLDDIITLNQFENIMFKNGFDDQGYMWKEPINSSRQIESSKEMNLNEFCKILNTDDSYKEQFKDWVRDGIHGNDVLSYERWMEQFDDFGETFNSNSDKEITEFEVDVGENHDNTIHVEKVDGKWRSSDGKSFMGYLKPEDVVTWLRKDYGTAFLKSSRRNNMIKSAVDGGWEVDSSDVPEALDLFVEYFGEETALEEIAKAMGDNTLRENLEWIARQFDIAEDLENSNTWDMYDEMLEVMGVSELFNNLTQAAGYDELAEDLAFIFRQYDFQEWDK